MEPDIQLVQSVQEGDLDRVRSALAAGADPNRVVTEPRFGDVPILALAASSGSLPIVEALLAAGAAVNGRVPGDRPPSDRTALMAAAAAGHLDVVRALLNASADPDLKDRSFLEVTVGVMRLAREDFPRRRTALMMAAEQGHLDVIHALIEGGADVNAKGAGVAPTALLAAIHQGQREAALALLAAGANPNEPSGKGKAPLWVVLLDQVDAELARILIERGADVNAPGPQNESVLEWIQARPNRKNLTALLPLLQEKGAKGSWQIQREAKLQALRQKQKSAAPAKPAPPPPAAPLRNDRGIAYIDAAGPGPARLNTDVKEHLLVLVRGDVQAVARAFQKHRNARVWIQGAIGQEIAWSSDVYTVFRFQGQDWSAIRHEFLVQRAPEHSLTSEDARVLSLALGTEAIYYEMEEESGTLGYIWFRSGEKIETFGSGAGFAEETQDVDTSKIDALAFIDRFFREREALVTPPALGLQDASGRQVLQVPGLEPGRIERLDAVIL